MLDKTARKVLNYFIKNNNIQDINTISCNVKLIKNKDNSYNLSESALTDLLELDCIHKINGSEYELTNKGKMYFKQNRKTWIKSVLNGIVFPIIVSLITTLLTIYLSPYQSNKQDIEIQCNCKSDTIANP